MHEVKSIQELLSQIGRDEILLPEFQRGYVWNKDQVRGLVRSLYRKHPTGHLLVWRTCKGFTGNMEPDDVVLQERARREIDRAALPSEIFSAMAADLLLENRAGADAP